MLTRLYLSLPAPRLCLLKPAVPSPHQSSSMGLSTSGAAAHWLILVSWVPASHLVQHPWLQHSMRANRGQWGVMQVLQGC